MGPEEKAADGSVFAEEGLQDFSQRRRETD